MKQIDQKLEQEVEAILARWLERTEEALLYEMRRQRIGITRQLRQTLKTRLFKDGQLIRGEILFLDRGRFVDMGVGRGQKIAQLSKRPKSLRSRRPKRFYSPTTYGRLSMLAGALGIEFSEQFLGAMRETLKEG